MLDPWLTGETQIRTLSNPSQHRSPSQFRLPLLPPLPFYLRYPPLVSIKMLAVSTVRQTLADSKAPEISPPMRTSRTPNQTPKGARQCLLTDLGSRNRAVKMTVKLGAEASVLDLTAVVLLET